MSSKKGRRYDVDSMLTQNTSAASAGAKRSHHKRLLTAAELDGRRRGAKRARQIAAELMAGFGPRISVAQRQACERAGMLSALAEDISARALAGEVVDLLELVRMEGVARRAVADIQAAWPERKNGGEPEGWTLK
jgi:hypothetical protein